MFMVRSFFCVRCLFDIRKYARDGQINFESAGMQPDNIFFEPIIINY